MSENVENIIDFTLDETEPITFEAPGGDVEIVIGLRAHLFTLTQINIDNKYISSSIIESVMDKSLMQVFLEKCGIKFEYDVDYSVDSDKIIWDGYNIESNLKVGDKIKIYY